MKRILLLYGLVVFGTVAISQEERNDIIFSADEGSVKRNAVPGHYNGHDYFYYSKLYDESVGRQVAGSALTGVGIGIELVWATTRVVNDSSFYANYYSNDMGIIGLAYISVGVPLLISGLIRAANNKNAMEEIKVANMVSVVVKPEGITFVYRF